jgi:hypothetical protein
MKRTLVFGACLLFLVSAALSSPPEGYYGYSFARLNYVEGDVYVQRAEDLGYEEGVVNLVLIEGDKLGLNRGRAEVHLGKQNYLRASSFTQIDFIRLPREGDYLVELHLLSGEIFLRVNFLEREKGIEIHTPDASFYILEEGLYRVNIRENRETEFSVYEGVAEAAGEEGSLLLRREESIVVANGSFQSDPRYFNAYEGDDFASWSRSRDAQHNRIVSRGYLPSDLYEYEEELAYSGRWVYERPYGYVWVPYVRHFDWRPYLYGRWLWYPIIGWTWISQEPWGWCVYHYGRWHWRVGLGWYWIPTRYWGPAWVHWYRGYDYIGWCPLSYYGYPGVVLNNHFYGRYYDRYYPLHSRALTVIHKKHLQNPRISKVALRQSKVAKLGKISLSSKQPSIRPVVNRSGVAAKTLSRSSLRTVNKSYRSGKAARSSAIRSLRSDTSRRSLIQPRKPSGSLSRIVKKRGSTYLRSSTRMTARRNSSPSRSKLTTGRDSFSRINKVSRSGKNLRIYPSRKELTTLSRSRGLSSSFSRRRLGASSSRLKSAPLPQRGSSVRSYTPRRSNSFRSSSARSHTGRNFSRSISRSSTPKSSFSPRKNSPQRSMKSSSRRSSTSVRHSSRGRVKKK